MELQLINSDRHQLVGHLAPPYIYPRDAVSISSWRLQLSSRATEREQFSERDAIATPSAPGSHLPCPNPFPDRTLTDASDLRCRRDAREIARN